jgi:hypothetical protein
VLLALADTSPLEGHPGWLLRNTLLLAAVRWGVDSLQVPTGEVVGAAGLASPQSTLFTFLHHWGL